MVASAKAENDVILAPSAGKTEQQSYAAPLHCGHVLVLHLTFESQRVIVVRRLAEGKVRVLVDIVLVRLRGLQEHILEVTGVQVLPKGVQQEEVSDVELSDGLF